MKTRRLVFAAAALLSALAPHAAPPERRVASPGGLIAIYLKPFSADARALTLKVKSVAALREDGSSAPLTLALAELGGDATARQRLLAWGSLPPGSYSGLAIEVVSATLAGADGSRRMTVPEGPAVVPVPIGPNGRRAALLILDLEFAASRGEGDAFAPVFASSTASQLATGLMGVVSSASSNSLTVFDKVSGQVADLIPLNGRPAGLVLDEPRSRVYVALPDEDAIATVDLVERAVISRRALRSGDGPESVALTPDGRTLLAALSGSSVVGVYDAAGSTLVERARVSVGSGPRFVLSDRRGLRAWVFNELDDTVTVLGIASGVVAGTVPSAGGPFRGQFDRAGSRLYVAHRTSPHVDVLDTATLGVTQRVYVGPGVAAIRVDPRSGRVYLGFRDSRRVEIFDATSLLPVDGIAVGGGAGFVAIDGEGNNLCIVLPQQDEVRLVRVVGKSLVSRLDVPDPVEATLLGER